MSGECEKCAEHALDCECNGDPMNLLGLRNYYFAQMFFPEGYISKHICICEQILLTEDDVLLNVSAEKLAGNSTGIMVLWGLGKAMAFKYEGKKLKKLK